MKITKVVITGYLEYEQGVVEQMDLEILGREMNVNCGICTDIKYEELDIQNVDDLPAGTEDFFEVDEEE